MDKLICVGKNYLEHAQELGDAVPEMPVLFLKPPSVAVAVQQKGEVELPKGVGSIHHECEIVVQIDHQGVIQAVSLGLDMTLREVQGALKKQGHPWEISKVFRGSAILGPWIRLHDFPNYLGEEFTFSLDGKVCQRGRGSQMRLSPEKCISYANQHFPLCDGDVVFTGTPAGVGPVVPGQLAEVKWGKYLSYQVKFT
jgi:2-keto-4-pentenoate hydratase/2-oxohepta-3-ene-1,7-dioic acid hydratase in catechol pathway